MEIQSFVESLQARIARRKKMTSRLYQVILAGKASQRLLQNFVIHRIPIKSLWTRNILGIAARIEDYQLRAELVKNVYEEETGAITGTNRHLDAFCRFGEAVGLSAEVMSNPVILPETRAVMSHNLRACNSSVHFTAGVASVLLLMEGQPPIVSKEGRSMEAVMRDVYCLPPRGFQFFSLHSSLAKEVGSGSELEDQHAEVARELLRRYCTTEELQQQAISFLEEAIELRHRHFDAIYDGFYDPSEEPFRCSRHAEGATAATASAF
jgi:pyrroloquinoline-quinone synthase